MNTLIQKINKVENEIEEKITTANLYTISDKDKHVKISNERTLLGLVLFIIIFAILIPILLMKNGFSDLLESYMPNLDLLAGLVSFEKGILPGYLFVDLYQASPVTLSAFISQVSINYMALLGVTFLIARETFITKSIAKGWSIGLVMLLVTYLLPGQFISSVMSKTKDMVTTINPNNNMPYIVSLVIGSILTMSFILLERFLIKNLRKHLDKVGEFVVNIPKLISYK